MQNIPTARRVAYLVAAFLVACRLAPCFAADATPERPNVILFMTDDAGHECFGCYGSEQYSTPNIDRMAAQGVRFTQCHSQPLCTPSRVKLMTGLSNARNYAAFSVLRRDQRTIGHMMRDAGYTTLVAGKWQLLGAEHYPKRFRGKGTWPKDAGFDFVCLWQVDKKGDRYWTPTLFIDGANHEFTDTSNGEPYGPTVVNDYVLKFLDEHHDKPFFIYYPMILPHDPFLPTPDSARRDETDDQKNFEDMIAFADKMVGRVVAKTEALGIAEKTLILFTSDNGTHRSLKSTLHGETIHGGKGLTTDAGTHVPLVAYQPGATPTGATCDDLVEFTDLAPTVFEAAGAPRPDPCDGQSFLPQIRGETGSPRETIYCYYCPRPERTSPVWFVRDARYKLYGDGRLFDVEADQLEAHPIPNAPADSPSAQARSKLQAALDAAPTEGRVLLEFE